MLSKPSFWTRVMSQLNQSSLETGPAIVFDHFKLKKREKEVRSAIYIVGFLTKPWLPQAASGSVNSPYASMLPGNRCGAKP